MTEYVWIGYTVLVVWLIGGVWRLTRRRGRRVTPGTALLSSMDLLFDDTRRAAIEVMSKSAPENAILRTKMVTFRNWSIPGR